MYLNLLITMSYIFEKVFEKGFFRKVFKVFFGYLKSIFRILKKSISILSTTNVFDPMSYVHAIT